MNTRNPEEEARRLRARFAAVTAADLANRQKPARRRRALYAVGIAAMGFIAAFGGLSASPWPPSQTLRHLGAWPNCAAARALGVALARPGQPGYYARHDADSDGIACEPIPRR